MQTSWTCVLSRDTKLITCSSFVFINTSDCYPFRYFHLQAKEATKKPTKAKAAEAPPIKEPAKKGKRAKAAAVISSSDDDSDSASKKPAAVKKTKIAKVPRHPLLQSTANGLLGLCDEI